MNYSIKLDLLRIQGAALCNMRNQDGSLTRCVVIPVAGSGIFVGEKGVYLNLSATELKEQRFDQTHLVKAELTRDAYQALSEEQRRQLPILGNMKERQTAVTQTMQPTVTVSQSQMTPVQTLPQQPVQPQQQTFAPQTPPAVTSDDLPF